MPMTGVDPLQEFLSSLTGDRKPIPLVATRIDVLIRGGLATVTTERTFRNSEKQSIEATMTFPVRAQRAHRRAHTQRDRLGARGGARDL